MFHGNGDDAIASGKRLVGKTIAFCSKEQRKPLLSSKDRAVEGKRLLFYCECRTAKTLFMKLVTGSLRPGGTKESPWYLENGSHGDP